MLDIKKGQHFVMKHNPEVTLEVTEANPAKGILRTCSYIAGEMFAVLEVREDLQEYAESVQGIETDFDLWHNKEENIMACVLRCAAEYPQDGTNNTGLEIGKYYELKKSSLVGAVITRIDEDRHAIKYHVFLMGRYACTLSISDDPANFKGAVEGITADHELREVAPTVGDFDPEEGLNRRVGFIKNKTARPINNTRH